MLYKLNIDNKLIIIYCKNFIFVVIFNYMSGKFLFVISIFLLCLSNSYAVSINSVEYIDTNRALFAIANDENKASIFRITMNSCNAERVDQLDFIPKISTVSKYYPTYLILTDGSTLLLYNIINNTRIVAAESHDKNIIAIYQDSSGEYIASTDGYSIILYRMINEQPIFQFKKNFVVNIVTAAINIDKRHLYTADKTGVISTWNFSGRLMKLTDTKLPIISIIPDERFNYVLIHARNAIYQANEEFTDISIFLRLPFDKVFLDSRFARLITLKGNNIVIYDYNSKGILYNLKLNGGKIANITDVNMLVIFIGDSMRIYDLTKGLYVGKIILTKKGAIFDGVSALTKNISGNDIADLIRINPTAPVPRESMCAAFASVISGVYAVKPIPIIVVEEVVVELLDNITEPTEPMVEYLSKPTSPSVPPIKESDEVTIFSYGYDQISTPEDPKIPVMIDNIVEPKTPRLPEIKNKQKLMVDSSIPMWIINRNKLAKFASVKSSVTENKAIEASKLEIKNSIVRSVMTQLAKDPDIMMIKNVKVRNRLIWMIASNIALSFDFAMHVKERWMSVNGLYYVLVQLEESRVDDLYDATYQKEFGKLKSLGNDAYMREKPNKIE